MTNPTFVAPNNAPVPPGPRANLIEVDKALESMRDAGFDLTAAVGEPIDNSIEANATIVRVMPIYSKDKKHITDVVFADNGRGIDPQVLPNVLTMGYSSRYGQRKGLGRFGVGLKLAGLSVGTRIEVYTRPAGSDEIHHAFLDLDLIKSGDQEYIEASIVDGWPPEYERLMTDDKGNPFPHGTLVLWCSIDRLSSGGTYGTSLDAKMAELRKFIARAYRKFLDQGLVIELDGKKTTLQDPLFLLDNPRIQRRYRDLPDAELRGQVIDEGDLDIDGYNVHVTVTIAPEMFRPERGAGGDRDMYGKDIREFQIPDNEGCISIVRNGREIYYDIVPKLLPTGVETIDRFIGVEVTFPAELDEYFQVRHVKRGAEPVSKLRQELRTWLAKPIKQARVAIRKHWDEVKATKQNTSGPHDDVIDAVARADETAPGGQAGFDVTDEQAEQMIENLFDDLLIDSEAEPEKAERIRSQILDKPITLVDGAWPGKEMMEINHLNGRAVVTLNHRHPFIREVYDPLRDTANQSSEAVDPTELLELIRRSSGALSVLFMAYAKAENLHADPTVFDDLRSYWGQQAQSYMKELAKDGE